MLGAALHLGVDAGRRQLGRLALELGDVRCPAVLFVEVPETGLYTLSVYGVPGGGQRVNGRPAAAVNRQREPVLQQIEGHGAAHQAESDETG